MTINELDLTRLRNKEHFQFNTSVKLLCLLTLPGTSAKAKLSN
jgi:hypothetical protein